MKNSGKRLYWETNFFKKLYFNKKSGTGVSTLYWAYFLIRSLSVKVIKRKRRKILVAYTLYSKRMYPNKLIVYL